MRFNAVEGLWLHVLVQQWRSGDIMRLYFFFFGSIRNRECVEFYILLVARYAHWSFNFKMSERWINLVVRANFVYIFFYWSYRTLIFRVQCFSWRCIFYFERKVFSSFVFSSILICKYWRWKYKKTFSLRNYVQFSCRIKSYILDALSSTCASDLFSEDIS